ncbi:MAG: hypothetical protein IPJ30_14405 [Acidobacteria bacterium]|nr:hypothetical protein [Acidobacteriota bacterium]
MDGLAVDRFEVLFAAAINVKQVDEVFPALFERDEIRRQFAGARELLVVFLDLILLPFEIIDGLALARQNSRIIFSR